MPAIRNIKHEAYAQHLADGHPDYKAYEMAGFKPNRANASHLKRNDKVAQRVVEILAERQEIERASTKLAIDALGVTKEQVVRELARIGFADIRKAVRWGRSPIDTTSENASPNGLGIYPVELIPSELIDDDTAAAVSEVSLTQSGIKIKLHDKKGALIELLRLLNVSAPPKAEDAPQPGAEQPAGSNVVHFDAALKRFG